MKSKTSPGKVLIIDSDTISCNGLLEGLIVFQLLEMGVPNSSMVKSYGRLKNICSNMKTRKYSIWELGKSRFWSGLVLVVQIRAALSNQA